MSVRALSSIKFAIVKRNEAKGANQQKRKAKSTMQTAIDTRNGKKQL
jgi:hypothetical protein